MKGTRRSGRGRKGGPRRGSSGSAPPESLHPLETPPEVESFREWGLAPEILAKIEEMGIHRPTPIQALTIGPLLEGRDVIAKAETGTGKTLAFGAPLMSRVEAARATVLCLVLCPTRELSEQVHGVLTELGRARGLRVALIVGGEEMGPQVEALQAGAQVVVGTPGRVLDLMGQGFLSFPWAEFAVLDEADKMLEIGFLDDVKRILRAMPDERQTMLFSATFPPELMRLAREHTRDPVEVATALGLATVDTISQYFVEVSEEGRVRELARLIETSDDDDIFLVFGDRRTDVDRLLRRMERLRFPIKALHGGYDQAARFRVMGAFRAGEVKALLATDVASRGLDVEHVTHVVNFGVPRDVEDYTHRIGRTGRAGRRGIAITFVTPASRGRWNALSRRAPGTREQLQNASQLNRGRGPGSPGGTGGTGGSRRSRRSRSSGDAPGAAAPERRWKDGGRRPERSGAPAGEPEPPVRAEPSPPSTPFGVGVEGAESERKTRRRRRKEPTAEPKRPAGPDALDFGSGV